MPWGELNPTKDLTGVINVVLATPKQKKDLKRSPSYIF